MKTIITSIFATIALFGFADPANASTDREVVDAHIVGGALDLRPQAEIKVRLDNGRTKVRSRCTWAGDTRCWAYTGSENYLSFHFGNVVGWVQVEVRDHGDHVHLISPDN